MNCNYSNCSGCGGMCGGRCSGNCSTCPYKNQCPLRLMVYSNYGGYIARPNYSNANGLNKSGVRTNVVSASKSDIRCCNIFNRSCCNITSPKM